MGEAKLTYRIMRIRQAPPPDVVELVDVEWSVEPEDGEAAVVLNDQVRVPTGSSDQEVIAEIEYRGRTYVRPRYLVRPAAAASEQRRGLIGKRREFEEEKR